TAPWSGTPTRWASTSTPRRTSGSAGSGCPRRTQRERAVDRRRRRRRAGPVRQDGRGGRRRPGRRRVPRRPVPRPPRHLRPQAAVAVPGRRAERTARVPRAPVAVRPGDGLLRRPRPLPAHLRRRGAGRPGVRRRLRTPPDRHAGRALDVRSRRLPRRRRGLRRAAPHPPAAPPAARPHTGARRDPEPGPRPRRWAQGQPRLPPRHGGPHRRGRDDRLPPEPPMTAGPLAALPVPGLVGGAADLVLQVAPAAVDAARDAVAGWLALLRGPLAGTAADAWARLAPALAALGPLTAVAGAIRSCRHVFVPSRSDGAPTHLFGEAVRE